MYTFILTDSTKTHTRNSHISSYNRVMDWRGKDGVRLYLYIEYKTAKRKVLSGRSTVTWLIVMQAILMKAYDFCRAL